MIWLGRPIDWRLMIFIFIKKSRMVINKYIESSTLEGEIENDLIFCPNNHF
jgi:hypothetical protein